MTYVAIRWTMVIKRHSSINHYNNYLCWKFNFVHKINVIRRNSITMSRHSAGSSFTNVKNDLIYAKSMMLLEKEQIVYSWNILTPCCWLFFWNLSFAPVTYIDCMRGWLGIYLYCDIDFFNTSLIFNVVWCWL
jgi:hypothetical protein